MNHGRTMNHLSLLKTFSPCTSGLEWYNGQEPYRAWKSCPRGDWLLWTAGRIGVDRKLLVAAACNCEEVRAAADAADAADAAAAAIHHKTAVVVRRAIPWKIIKAAVEARISGRGGVRWGR